MITGHELTPNQSPKPVYRPISSIKSFLYVPVPWGDQIGRMYFKIGKKKDGFNGRATDLFGREGFPIYGSVIIEVQRSTWNYLRVSGPDDGVREKVSHLALGRHEIVPDPHGYWRTDILIEDDQDIMAIRMVL